jgi:hypothetical protein
MMESSLAMAASFAGLQISAPGNGGIALRDADQPG